MLGGQLGDLTPVEAQQRPGAACGARLQRPPRGHGCVSGREGRTAGGEDYPLHAIDGAVPRIGLPLRYPFGRPVVFVERPIFYLNVFVNGVVCRGEQWLPSKSLDLLVRLACFDPPHVSPGLPADACAADRYLVQGRESPDACPINRTGLGGERVVRFLFRLRAQRRDPDLNPDMAIRWPGLAPDPSGAGRAAAPAC